MQRINKTRQIIYICNPSNCASECDKSCGIGKYLDHKSCICRNSLVDKLVEECTNVIDRNKIFRFHQMTVLYVI